MDKKSFLIYHDYREHFALLSYEQIGQLVMALLDYSESGKTPNLTGASGMAFSFLRAQIDRDHQKYEEKCDKARKNAQKRWNKPATPCARIPEDANRCFTDTDTETDTKTGTEKDTDTNVPPNPPKGDAQTEEQFALFWEKYPKKMGRAAAEKVWKRLCPDGELFSRIMDALCAAVYCDQWRREEGRFIPNPAAWLSGRRWEDELRIQTPGDRERTYDMDAYEELDFLQVMGAPENIPLHASGSPPPPEGTHR